MASADAIRHLLDQRILVLDGAWGTMLQGQACGRRTIAATASASIRGI